MLLRRARPEAPAAQEPGADADRSPDAGASSLAGVTVAGMADVGLAGAPAPVAARITWSRNPRWSRSHHRDVLLTDVSLFGVGILDGSDDLFEVGQLLGLEVLGATGRVRVKRVDERRDQGTTHYGAEFVGEHADVLSALRDKLPIR